MRLLLSPKAHVAVWYIYMGLKGVTMSQLEFWAYVSNIKLRGASWKVGGKIRRLGRSPDSSRSGLFRPRLEFWAILTATISSSAPNYTARKPKYHQIETMTLSISKCIGRVGVGSGLS